MDSEKLDRTVSYTERHMEIEPGKSELLNNSALVGAAHLFKEDGSGQVVARLLIPRPTADPRDPLTWSTWRKHSAFAAICFFVFLSNYTLSAVFPLYVRLISVYHASSAEVSYLITFNILVLGLANLFWVPLAQKIGKRPVLVLGAAIFFAASLWSTVAQSYGSQLGARIIQAFGAGGSEALGPAVIADLYFLHERGAKVGFYTFMIGGGSAIGGIFAGLVANANQNFRWTFGMNAILTGVNFFLSLLFQAETNFARETNSDNQEGLLSSELAAIQAQANSSYFQSLSLFAWYDKTTSIFRLWYKPLLCLRFPAVIWVSVTYGVALGWFVLIQTADSSAFPALYGYSSLGVGNLSIASLVGAVIGSTVGGPLTDYFVAAMSKRRKGYFKPEYRLWCCLPPMLFGPTGLLMWGGGLQNHLHPMVAISGIAMAYGVLTSVPTVGITYVVDCYRPLAGDAITVLTAFKNTFAFGLSFAVTPWIQRNGYLNVAGICTSIEGVFFLTTIPLYIFGERLRKWSSTLKM